MTQLATPDIKELLRRAEALGEGAPVAETPSKTTPPAPSLPAPLTIAELLARAEKLGTPAKDPAAPPDEGQIISQAFEETLRPTFKAGPASSGGIINAETPKPVRLPKSKEDFYRMASGVVRAFGNSEAAALKGISVDAKMLAKLYPEDAQEFLVEKDVRDMALWQYGKALEEFVQKHIESVPEGDRQFILDDIPEAFGSMAAFMLGGFGAKSLRGVRLLLFGATLGGAEQAQTAIDVGATPEEQDIAIALGMILGLTDAPPALRILSRLNRASKGKLVPLLKTFRVPSPLKDGTFELAQEGLQTLGSNAIAIEVLGVEREYMEDVVRAGAAGGVVGTIVSAMMGGAGRLRGRGGLPKPVSEGPLPDVARVDAVSPEVVREIVAQNPEIAQAIADDLKPSRRSEPIKALQKILPKAEVDKMSGDERNRMSVVLRKEIADGTARSPQEGVPEEAQAKEAAEPRSQAKGAAEEAAIAVPPAPVAPPDPVVEPRKKGFRRKATEVIAPPARPTEAQGIIAPGDIVQTARRLGNVVRKVAGRFLRPRGDLPAAVFEAQIKSKAGTQAILKQAGFALDDFDRAAKTAFGGQRKMSVEQEKLVADVLKRERPLRDIPKEMHRPVARFRSHIDSLSRALIDAGAAEGPLVATFDKNIGVYATRTYKVHRDPKWAERVDPAVREKMKALLRNELETEGLGAETELQLEARIENLLYQGKAADTPIAWLQRGKILGQKDLSILKRRKDLPPELRALFGEDENARVNYIQSVFRMAHLLENQKFLNEVRTAGMGKFFFGRETIQDGEKFIDEFKVKPESALVPLNGLFTSPDIMRAFERAMDPAQYGKLFRHYMKVNGAVKYSKTILSMMTHVRNYISNIGFAILQGHWRVWNIKGAAYATLTSLGAGSSKKFREFYIKLVALGVAADTARAGELQEVVRDATGKSADHMSAFASNNAVKRIGGKTLKLFEEVYRAEDDFWKIFGYLNEADRYRKSHPEWSEEHIEQLSAKRVRDSYPTYSMIPEAFKQLRRFPVVGMFVSFPAEVGRIAINVPGQIREDLADPKTRWIAYERMAGTAAVIAIVPAMAATWRFLSGTSMDEDRDKRLFLPHWSENSHLLHQGSTERAVQRYIDVSYTDPFNYLRKPYIAFMRGDDSFDRVRDAVMEAVQPLISEEMLFTRITSATRNKKPTGGPVYNPQDEPLRKVADILEHVVYEPLEPGTVSRARKFIKGVRGETSLYGKKYDPMTEALAEMTGIRRTTLDVKQALEFKAGKFARDSKEATSIISKVARRRGTLQKEEFLQAHTSHEKARLRNVEQASEIYHAAMRLGVLEKEADAVMRERFSRERLEEIITGVAQEDAWLSDVLYQATGPSADEFDSRAARRAIDFLGVSEEKAEELLAREYGWQTIRAKDKQPRTPQKSKYTGGRFRSTAFGDRVRRLSTLLKKER